MLFIQVNCAGRQVSSASVKNLIPSFHSGPASANENQEKLITGIHVHGKLTQTNYESLIVSAENLMLLFHSGSASANENQERLITGNHIHRKLTLAKIFIVLCEYACTLFCFCYSVTRQSLHMELCDQIEQLVPPQFQELRFLMYRLLLEDPELYNTFVQTLRRQMCVQLVEPHTAEALPTTYIQGVGEMSMLYDGSDPDHEKFSKTYNMPYYFSPPPCGEPCSIPSLSVHVINSPYPVSLSILLQLDIECL